MKQAGRISAASLAVVRTLPGRLLPAPPDLTAEQAEVWGRVVASKSGDWFDAASMVLLAAFCRGAIELERVGVAVESMSARMAEPDFDLAIYKELRKIQSALSSDVSGLARSMRLTQQARYFPDKATTKARAGATAKPWQQDHKVIDAG